MCKFLLRGPLEPVLPDDPVEALKKFKPGDFVVAVPDDHVFGQGECEPLFMVLNIPGMTVEEGQRLCVSPKNQIDSSNHIVKFAPRALINFDLSLVDDDVTKAELLDTVTINPLLENPEIIGQPDNEVG